MKVISKITVALMVVVLALQGAVVFAEDDAGLTPVEDSVAAKRLETFKFMSQENRRDYLLSEVSTLDFRMVLEDLIDRAKYRLAKRMVEVENNPSVPEVLKREILDNLEDNKKWLMDKKNMVGDLEGDELRDLVMEVREHVREQRDDYRKFLARYRSSRLDAWMMKSDKLVERVQAELVKMENTEMDTMWLKEALDGYVAAAEEAEMKLEAAKMKFDEMAVTESMEETKMMFMEGKKLFYEGKMMLKDAFKELKMTVKDNKKSYKEEMSEEKKDMEKYEKMKEYEAKEKPETYEKKYDY